MGVDPVAARFLRRHWDRPLPPQGEAPAGWPKVERSLEPGSCATCHIEQFTDWSQSRHALGMGAGLLGQWVEEERGQLAAQGCLFCHAPLAEQAASARGQDGGLSHLAGLTCAGCHVRKRVVFGPPPLPGKEPRPEAHGGFTVGAACHQFDRSGLALRGKPLEDTFREWKNSPAAAQGKSCQSCHMPERRHLWRGIHDPDMVRAAVTLTADLAPDRGGEVAARLEVTNSGAGHNYPTYVTPRVTLEACQVDAAGEGLEGTCSEALISREVTLDLAAERADTRIAPGESMVVDYVLPRAAAAVALRVRLIVDPDHFSRGFFASFLATGRGDADLMRAAHDETLANRFVALEAVLPLP